ncbi:efflux transporter outer membrane subunit [Polynucleobacter sp. AP-Nickl1-40-C4]|uniref:efflux transporter outer membrane subunit n=1 Tax=Polynucleobacter sp. AP-Nickl1-40-C4 TaxID=3108275 RepID=UPI002B23E600|nr:efflux transporter outer membrane subunit [Polynucleobacter sp. AP-Nickl1-40-C4]MEA9567391.1 efflux transporter outer membrane subunit [Polynucleobacter sp. AP-Nickl1-40-C4]
MPLPRNTITHALIISGTLMLAGCMMVGPDFARPPVKAVDQYKSTAQTEFTESLGENSNKILDPVEWWKSFNDPTLNALLKQATAQNLTLQQTALRIYQLQAQLGVSDAALLPSANLSASYSNTRNSAIQEAINDSNNLVSKNALVQVSWELDFWGKNRRGIQSSLSSYLSGVAAFYSADVSLTADVANTYINIRNYEELIMVAKTNLALQKESLRIAGARFKYGATSMLDLSQAQAQYEQTKAQIPALIANLKKNQHAMSILLGEPPEYYEKTYGNTKGSLKPPSELGVGMPRDLLRRRPDVLQAEFDAASKSALIGVSKAQLFPTFTLGGLFGYATSNYGTLSSANLFSWGNNSSGVNAGISLPLFYRGAIVDQVRVQDAIFQQSLLAYQNQVLNAQKEVEDSLITISTTKSSKEDLTRGVVAAQSAADLALERYKAGQNDYTTVITAQQNLLNIQNSLVQTSSNELIGYVGAFKALGGGWTADMSPPKLPDQMVADMTDRTDWGSVLTRTGDPLTVKASKFLVDAPDPLKPTQTTVPATLNTPSNTTTPPTQGSAAP